MKITAPQPAETFGFYDTYINRVRHTDLFDALETAHRETLAILEPLDDATLNYRYAEGKWSIKEIIHHLIDAERNFSMRAMRFSRGDRAVIPAYDVHSFVLNSKANHRTKEDLLEEWDLLRRATILQFKTFEPAMLDLTGPARDIEISVRALGFLVAGHEMHHMGVVKERYLGAPTV